MLVRRRLFLNTLPLSSGAVAASADLLLLEQPLALQSPSLLVQLLSQVRQHVRLHLLPGVDQCASLPAHREPTDVQDPAEGRHFEMRVRLGVCLRDLYSFPLAEGESKEPRGVFFRAAYEKNQRFNSLSPDYVCRTDGLHHPPRRGGVLFNFDSFKPQKGDDGGRSRLWGEAEGTEDGAVLRRSLLAVLCTVSHHPAAGLPGESWHFEGLRHQEHDSEEPHHHALPRQPELHLRPDHVLLHE